MATDFSEFKYRDQIGVGEKARRLLWEIVYVLFFRPTPRWILHGWRRTLLRVFGAQIGTGTRVAPGARIWAPWNLKIGNFSAIADDVDLYTMDKVIIGSKVAISQRSFICTGSHD